MATQTPNPFCTALPTQLRAWDATSLRSYETCPRRYQYEIVEGWRRPAGLHVEWGRMYHAAVEEYDKARARGLDKDAALDAAFGWALENSGEYLDEHQEVSTDGVWFPWDSGDTKKNRYTLLRAVVWYVDEQPETGGVEAYVFPDGRPAVELSYQLPLPITTPDGEAYILCGHLDGIATTGERDIFIRERKTTGNTIGSYYFDQFQPDVQIDTYDLAGNVMFPALGLRNVMLEATQVGVGFSRFHRQMLHSTEGRREEHLRDTMHWIKQAEQNARDGYYPMNKASCYAKGGCPFREICAKDPAVRNVFLKANYVQQHWNPLQER